MFSNAVGNLLQVNNNEENEKMTSLVKGLIEELDVKDSSTKDVAMFRLSKFDKTRKIVDDTFEDIRKIVPRTMTVISPLLNERIDDIRLRKFSMMIFVTDVSNAVSF